jgi:hypothetical protein
MITTYDVGNPGPGFGQALTCGGVKSVNGITLLWCFVYIAIIVFTI